ncbi:MAG: FadR family transcriptional regulator [Chelatococcus sp.]|jgi:GntR family transcriptional repressor for pyruvate dehydrogenase complex|uniref:FadR/GntR family transcriptional regulator n=1 Tax=Chelatococcus sp. TaxID=1953771 RepID=UPI0025C5B130|nr:FCD domain-containing protein [Chelatococcus sp.]MBX3538600.1 FadR family transcriptional regulator [Chelatococcus sp.]
MAAVSSRKTAVLPQLDTAPGYKRVAKLIEAEIVAGRLKEGDLLPTEGDLADQLGVHRSTIREGIRSLENSGLVRRAGGKRLMVATPDASSIAMSNIRALGLKQVSFNELWEAQMELEPFCAKLAATRMTEDIEAALVRNVDRLRSNLDNDDVVIESDIEFHRLIAAASGNAVVALVAAPIGVLLFSATVQLYQTVAAARHRLLAAHEKILEGLIARDAAMAETWMRRHILDFKRGYEIAGFDFNAPIQLEARAFASFS